MKHGYGFLIIVLFLASCSSGREILEDPGTTHVHQIGHPEVLARVTSFFDEEENPIAELNVELPHQSLVFKNLQGRRFAEVEISGIFRTGSAREEVASRFTEPLEIVVTPEGDAHTTFFNNSTALEPGSYELELNVRDKSSGKTTTTRLIVNIPDAEAPMASITDIKVITRGDGSEQTTSSYMVPASRDSLSFEYYVTRSSGEQPVEIRMRLVQFRSDTEPARPMAQLPISSGNIAYRGIDFSDRTDISSQTRTLDSEIGPVLIDYSLERPGNGNYRFEVEIITEDSLGNETKDSRFRDFAVVSTNFPRVQSPREMAEPLFYLMRQRDYRNMMASEDPDSIRLHVDRFWLKNMTASQARDQIQRYYSRVEDANRLFTNYKEGWKTDMGLVYILLGPPLYVDNNIDSMIWHYSYNRMDPRTMVVFERARITSNSWPFRHYILARSRFYQNIELERIGDWTSGRPPRMN